MYIYQLVFISILGIIFRNSIQVSNLNQPYNITPLLLSSVQVMYLKVAMYYQQNKSTSQPINPYGCLQQLLLMISGTVKINPAPARLKYPCSQCNCAVKKYESSVTCASCNNWYHKGCFSMGDQVFHCYVQNENLEQICMNFALNNISNSAFNSSISSNASDVPPENIQRKKTKHLHIPVSNLLSIWNKNVLLKHYLPTINDIDVLIGSESHLSSDIMNSAILSINYAAACNDCSDGHGGVIVIYKNT